MQVPLTRPQIDATLPRLAKDVEKYLWIQKHCGLPHRVRSNATFQKRFNDFYKVRLNEARRRDFFSLMQSMKKKRRLPFSMVLRDLSKRTKRLEASFSSKLLATLNPEMPVIDSKVLRNLNARLPSPAAPDRFRVVCKLHLQLRANYKKFLRSACGRYLVSKFKRNYPHAHITEIKMLDLILWKL